MKHTAHTIEALESRIAPATLWQATLAAGTLTLTGSADSDALAMQVTSGGTFVAQGFTGDTFTFDGVTTSRFLFVDAVKVKSVILNLGAGEDITGGQYLDLPGKFEVRKSAGSVVVDLSSSAIKGDLLVQGATGDDTVRFQQTVIIGGKVTLNLGEGNNQVNTGAEHTVLRVGKAFTVTTGGGDDVLDLGGNNVAGGGILDLRGALTFTSAGGDDDFLLESGASISVAGKITVAPGTLPGDVTRLEIETRGAVKLTQPLTLTAPQGVGAHLFIEAGTWSSGAITVNGGAGNDNVSIIVGEMQRLPKFTFPAGDGDNSLLISMSAGKMGALNYTGGAGDDSVETETRGVFGGNSIINLGGATTANIAHIQSGGGRFLGGLTILSPGALDAQISEMFVLGKLTITGGDSADTVNLDSVRIGGATNIDLLAGDDTLRIETGVGLAPSIFGGKFTAFLRAGDDTAIIGPGTGFGVHTVLFKLKSLIDLGPAATANTYTETPGTITAPKGYTFVP